VRHDVEGDAEVRYTAAAQAALDQADEASFESPAKSSSWPYQLLFALVKEPTPFRSASAWPHAYELLIDLGVDITTLRREIDAALTRPGARRMGQATAGLRAAILYDASTSAEIPGQEHIVGTAHLLCGSLRYHRFLGLPALDHVSYVDALGRILGARGKPVTKRLSAKVIEAQLTAHLVAAALGYNYVGTEHLLLALLEISEGMSTPLTRGLPAERMRQRVLAVTRTERLGGPIPRETAELKAVYALAERERKYSADGLLSALARTRNSVARGAFVDFQRNIDWRREPWKPVDTRMGDPPKPTLLSNPYTDEAKRVLVVAQSEAQELGGALFLQYNHVLLAMLREDRGIASAALERSGIAYDTARRRMRESVRSGLPCESEHLSLGESLRSVLCGDAVETARMLRSEQVDPEHVLLSLIRDADGDTARTLADLGADSAAVRRHLKALLVERAEDLSSQPPSATASTHASAQDWASTQVATLRAGRH